MEKLDVLMPYKELEGIRKPSRTSLAPVELRHLTSRGGESRDACVRGPEPDPWIGESIDMGSTDMRSPRVVIHWQQVVPIAHL